MSVMSNLSRVSADSAAVVVMAARAFDWIVVDNLDEGRRSSAEGSITLIRDDDDVVVVFDGGLASWEHRKNAQVIATSRMAAILNGAEPPVGPKSRLSGLLRVLGEV